MSEYAKPEVLVDTDWVEAHLNDDAVRMVEVLLQPVQSLFGLCNGLVSSSLFGGQWRRNGLTEFMLHMEQVRRVMGPKVMFIIREESRGFITGRLNALAMQASKGVFHQGMPGVLIACQCRLL